MLYIVQAFTYGSNYTAFPRPAAFPRLRAVVNGIEYQLRNRIPSLCPVEKHMRPGKEFSWARKDRQGGKPWAIHTKVESRAGTRDSTQQLNIRLTTGKYIWAYCPIASCRIRANVPIGLHTLNVPKALPIYAALSLYRVYLNVVIKNPPCLRKKLLP